MPYLKGEWKVRMLTLGEVADYLEDAIIHKTIDAGHAIIHIGESMAGHAFVLVNDGNGDSVLTEGM